MADSNEGGTLNEIPAPEMFNRAEVVDMDQARLMFGENGKPVSRPTVYGYAVTYGWRTFHLGRQRWFMRADVEATPSLEQRRADAHQRGVNTRQQRAAAAENRAADSVHTRLATAVG